MHEVKYNLQSSMSASHHFVFIFKIIFSRDRELKKTVIVILGLNVNQILYLFNTKKRLSMCLLCF